MHIPRRHFISCMALAAMRLSLYGQALILPLKPKFRAFCCNRRHGDGRAAAIRNRREDEHFS